MKAIDSIPLKNHIKMAITFFIVATILLGILYPVFVTMTGQILFPFQVNGSQLIDNNTNSKVDGSALIGQFFDDPNYFWGRISDTPVVPYNANASSGSNLAPSSPQLINQTQERIKDLKFYDPNNTAPIPVDLVTSSGSGLDPDISVASAYYQANRVARYQNISVQIIDRLIVKYTQSGDFIILGERRVNVLEINLELKNGIDYNSIPQNNSTLETFSFLGKPLLSSLNI